MAKFWAGNTSYNCDGIDDDVQINAALQTGKILQFDDNEVYNCSSRLVLPNGAVMLGGEDSMIRLTGNDHLMLATQVKDIQLQDLIFDGNGDSVTYDGHILRAEDVEHLFVSGCTFQNAYHHNIVSTGTRNGFWEIENTVSVNAGRGPGIQGDGFRPNTGFSTGPGVLRGCTASGNSHHGFHIGQRVRAEDCQSFDNTRFNYRLTGERAAISYCRGWDPTNGGNVQVEGAPGSLIEHSEFVGATAGFDAVRIMPDSQNVQVLHNDISGSTRHGIHSTTNATRVRDNFIHSNGGNGVRFSMGPTFLSDNEFVNNEWGDVHADQGVVLVERGNVGVQ